MRWLRGLVVFALAAWYISSLFQITHGVFWNAGLGDWMDPYYLNYVLEHWYRSLLTLRDPSSPPMFHPAPGTLAYSAALILYVPVYVAVRPFLHPFQAYNLTLFLIVLGGTLYLYAVLRRFLRLSFIESVLLTALFVTSANVSNAFVGVWATRAAVFLIPPLLWLTLVSIHRDAGRPSTALGARGRMALAALAGFLTALLYPTEYYTAHFAALLVLLATPAIVLAWRAGERPPFTAAAAKAWLLPFAIGVAAGLAVFFWMYLDAYREHPGFPETELLNQLIPWGERRAYESVRPFALVGLLTLMAWLLRSTIDRTTRLVCLWALLVAALVALIPYQIGGFSIWRTLIEPLPGYHVVRDPKRIAYVYELAVVLAAAVFITRVRKHVLLRATVVLVMGGLLAATWHHITLDFLRPNETYAAWVEGPIDIASSCRSFVIKAASPAYLQRPGSAWSLYHLDAMFIALRHSLPTLNGYSAWNPTGWAIGNPHEPGYTEAVRNWTTSQHLTDVCQLDIESRTMRP